MVSGFTHKIQNLVNPEFRVFICLFHVFPRIHTFGVLSSCCSKRVEDLWSSLLYNRVAIIPITVVAYGNKYSVITIRRQSCKYVKQRQPSFSHKHNCRQRHGHHFDYQIFRSYVVLSLAGSIMDDTSPRRRSSRRASSRSASPKRRSSSRLRSRSSKSLKQITSTVTEEFLHQIPPASDSSIRSKVDVISALQLRKDTMIAILRASDTLSSESFADDVCIELDLELTALIEQYITPISEAAKNMAKTKIKYYIPTDPNDIGIALPTLSRKYLDRVIEKKKGEVASQMASEMADFHITWYFDDESLGFENLINCWADTVRGNQNTHLLEYFVVVTHNNAELMHSFSNLSSPSLLQSLNPSYF